MPVKPKSPLETVRWLHQEKLTIFLVVFTVLVGGIWAFAVGPKAKAVRNLKQELSEKKLQLIGTEEAMKHIRDMDALISERRAELQKLDSRILKPGQESSMIEVFSDAAQSLPVTIVSIQPESEPPITEREPEDTSSWRKQGLRKSKLTINLQCRYQTLGLLLERLAESNLLFGVEQMNMRTQEGLAPNLDIRMVLTAYAEESAQYAAL